MVGFQQQTQKNHSNLVPIAQVEHEITKKPWSVIQKVLPGAQHSSSAVRLGEGGGKPQCPSGLC